MISLAKLIAKLGYDNSPNFLTGDLLEKVPSFAHIFRRAKKHCGLAGVYALRQDTSRIDGTLVPIVYVCEAESEDAAGKIHRHAWNQNAAPFVIVRTPKNIRIYSGFGYRETTPTSRRTASRILNEALTAEDLASKLVPSFHAEQIDNGLLWREKGKYVTPDTRVDWRLLDNLERLGGVLRDNMDLDPHAAHALIGKYVYLRYLRDRNILSNDRLDEFKIDRRSVFSRYAQLNSFRSLVEQLDDWLNGSVFDIPWSQGIKAEHVKQVAGAFFGDDPQTGQLNLYEDYDFSYIPIETLSVVYEQFLHSQGKARDVGAYYTPIPLVNFVLDELDARFPLKKGMRVLDPSCGSGAFLVQCYRRLIEKELPKRKDRKLRPVELRELLQDHIFGIDRDEDACQVTELSLALTLLDYVDPPDLSNTTFKLPILRGANIFGGKEEDFFNLDSQFHRKMGDDGFDWIVGNPPWTEFSAETPSPDDAFVAAWKAEHEEEYPTGGNQVAELFAWKATEHVHGLGNIGFLLPAMTLFKDESTPFRQAFFRDLKIHSVVNFANMAYVLFADRSRVPAAAFFYQLRVKDNDAEESEQILTFAPLVMNQESNRAPRFKQKLDTWNVVVNGSEMREIDVADAIRGDALTWKLAMWGSHRDRRLLESVAKRFPSLSDEQGRRKLTVLAGFELRDRHHEEEKIFVSDIVGEDELLVRAVRKYGRVFKFPNDVLRPISRNRAYLRIRGGKKPLEVCEPPHIIVHASRNFAVFSNKFIVVPPRQIGIAGSKEQASFLKVLSIFLSSDFATYHQFLNSPQWGISLNRANRDTLAGIPIPCTELSQRDLSEWLDLHSRLVKASPKKPKSTARSKKAKTNHADQRFLFDTREPRDKLTDLIDELNDRVYQLLDLRETERILVEDFVHVKRFAIQGKVSEDAAGIPDSKELEQYAKTLKSELDEFFDNDPKLRHRIIVQYDNHSRTGMVEVELLRNHRGPLRIKVQQADTSTSAEFERARKQMREKRSQWLYFERNLRIYEEPRTFLLKPLQRIHWLRSQALLDADTIIAETLAGGGE